MQALGYCQVCCPYAVKLIEEEKDVAEANATEKKNKNILLRCDIIYCLLDEREKRLNCCVYQLVATKRNLWPLRKVVVVHPLVHSVQQFV